MNPMPLKTAVFLDRDGVLIEDVELLVRSEHIRVLPGVAEAITLLKAAGFPLLVVSNQPVVARGLIAEAEVRALQREVETRLARQGAGPLDGFYFCPHHPQATLPAYRRACDCRKPGAGLLLRAAREHGIDLASSFLVGDRPTDIQAGARVGCRTIWVETGRHLDPPIVSREALPPPRPDHVCADLLAAARWIVSEARV